MLAVLDEADRPLRQCRLPNDLPTILKALEPFRDELTGVAVESTCHWYWLVDGLANHGYPMHRVSSSMIDALTPFGVLSEYSWSRSAWIAGQRRWIGKPDIRCA